MPASPSSIISELARMIKNQYFGVEIHTSSNNNGMEIYGSFKYCGRLYFYNIFLFYNGEYGVGLGNSISPSRVYEAKRFADEYSRTTGKERYENILVNEKGPSILRVKWGQFSSSDAYSCASRAVDVLSMLRDSNLADRLYSYK